MILPLSRRFVDHVRDTIGDAVGCAPNCRSVNPKTTTRVFRLESGFRVITRIIRMSAVGCTTWPRGSLNSGMCHEAADLSEPVLASLVLLACSHEPLLVLLEASPQTLFLEI